MTGPTTSAEATSNSTQGRVAVVGAGIGGLSAAFFLTKKGFSNVTIFESRSAEDIAEMCHRGNGIHLYFHCARMLVHAGLDIEKYLYPVDIEFRRDDGKLLADIGRDACLKLCKDLHVTKASAYSILRHQLYSAFYDVLKDKIVYQKRCTGVAVTEGGPYGSHQVEIEFADGSKEGGFDLVVGADGIHSKIADHVHGTTRPLRKFDAVGLQALSTFDQWDPDNMEPLFIHRDGNGGVGPNPCILPNGKKGMFWWMTIQFSDLYKATGKSNLKDISNQEIFDAVRKRYSDKQVVACLDNTIPDSFQRWPDLQDKDPLKPSSWLERTSSRIVLLGDACHATLPASGYGAGLALEDAFWLGHFLEGPECLADTKVLKSRLQQYIKKRAKWTSHIVKESRLIMSLMHPSNGVVRGMSNFGWSTGMPGFFIPRKFVSIYRTGLKETTWTEAEKEKGVLDL